MVEPNRLLTAAQVNRAAKQDNRLLRLSPEEEFLQSLSPVDAHRFAIEAQNAKKYTPEQAKNNLIQTGMDALYVTPVVGNVLSAADAYGYGRETLNATDDTERRKSALLTELSALGAITGLPFGNAATRAARAAASRTNIFAGPMAKTADLVALDNAKRLAKAGAARDDIWSQTGWFKGTDGKWRFEIDDSGAQLAGVTPGTRVGLFGDKPDPSKGSFTGIEHPQLEGAYGAPPGIHGQYSPDLQIEGAYLADPAGKSAPYVAAQGPSAKKALEASLHEQQHHVQDLEGFAGGGNPGQFADIWGPKADRVRIPMETKLVAEELGLKEIPWPGDPDYVRLKAAVKQSMEDKSGRPFKFHYVSDGMDDFDWDYGSTMRASKEQIAEQTRLGLRNLGVGQYQRLAGEVEARNVQSRMNMTPADRRATAPWLTQDVPDDQQIVRFR